MIQVERLSERDYEEALSVMNGSFSTPGNPADFLVKLPIMWAREHDYMSRHFAVRENGKMAAIIGVYPLPVRIVGRDLLFSTMGNVGTLPEYRGKGYMKALLAESIDELKRLNVDASRLGGQRQRYNRFGFDHAGTNYQFTLTAKNVSAFFGEEPRTLTFKLLEACDKEGIAYARSLHRRQGIYTLRETDTDFYLTQRAWDNYPYLALDADGKPVGYLAGLQNGTSIAEQGAETPEIYARMIREWLAEHPEAGATSFRLAPWETAETAELARYCDRWHLNDTSMFRISHWDTVSEALLALAATFREVPDGTATLGIEGFGTLTMTVENGVPHCEMTQDKAELTLDPLAATRFLFGPLPPYLYPLAQNSLFRRWLPLPLAWNGQDRV